MTDTALKLAIAKMLPEVVIWDLVIECLVLLAECRYVRDTELPHLVSLAEAKLEPYQWGEYTSHLRKIIAHDCEKPECYVPGCERAQLISDFWFYCATWQQRTLALCKTKGIEV